MAKARVLVVDDEKSMRDLLSITLEKEGYDVLTAAGGEAAIEALRRDATDAVITDLRMPKVDGLQVLRAAKEISPDVAVIVITAVASTETEVEAMKLGAYDYITKPFKLDEVSLIVRNALERKRLRDENLYLRKQLETQHRFENIIGKSGRILEVFDTIRKISDSPSTAMITGESGTGKELVARAIHFNSLRRDKPFVSVNCGAIPEGLMESELFGHVRGAFTGAVSNKVGLFSAVEGGTLFLAETTEIPPLLQVKLLRAIQTREIWRVGDTKDMKTDVRLIAASNRNLEDAVRDGILREDLYYRLNVIPIQLPPLRERREDIPLLVAHFLQKFGKDLGKEARGVAPGDTPARASGQGHGSGGAARGRARSGGHPRHHRAGISSAGPRSYRGCADEGGRAAQDDVSPVPLQAPEAQPSPQGIGRRCLTDFDRSSNRTCQPARTRMREKAPRSRRHKFSQSDVSGT